MIFFSLLLAHLLADFIFQPHALVAWKQKSPLGLLTHVGIHFVFYLIALFALLKDPRAVWLILGIVFLHFWIDYAKIALEARSKLFVGLFFLDQALHIFILGVVNWLLYLTFFPILPDLFQFDFFTFGIILFLILAIISSYFIEIIGFQIQLQKKPKASPQMDFRSMLMRMLVVSLLYGTALLVLFPSAF